MRRTTTVTTKVNVREALGRATTLTAEEERLLRMRRGIGLEPGDALELKGQDIAEARAKLAMIEQLAIEALEAPPEPEPTLEDNPTKAHIIRRLLGQ